MTATATEEGTLKARLWALARRLGKNKGELEEELLASAVAEREAEVEEARRKEEAAAATEESRRQRAIVMGFWKLRDAPGWPVVPRGELRQQTHPRLSAAEFKHGLDALLAARVVKDLPGLSSVCLLPSGAVLWTIRDLADSPGGRVPVQALIDACRLSSAALKHTLHFLCVACRINAHAPELGDGQHVRLPDVGEVASVSAIDIDEAERDLALGLVRQVAAAEKSDTVLLKQVARFVEGDLPRSALLMLHFEGRIELVKTPDHTPGHTIEVARQRWAKYGGFNAVSVKPPSRMGRVEALLATFRAGPPDFYEVDLELAVNELARTEIGRSR